MIKKVIAIMVSGLFAATVFTYGFNRNFLHVFALDKAPDVVQAPVIGKTLRSELFNINTGITTGGAVKIDQAAPSIDAYSSATKTVDQGSVGTANTTGAGVDVQNNCKQKLDNNDEQDNDKQKLDDNDKHDKDKHYDDNDNDRDDDSQAVKYFHKNQEHEIKVHYKISKRDDKDDDNYASDDGKDKQKHYNDRQDSHKTIINSDHNNKHDSNDNDDEQGDD